jgi:hypothetical protein
MDEKKKNTKQKYAATIGTVFIDIGKLAIGSLIFGSVTEGKPQPHTNTVVRRDLCHCIFSNRCYTGSIIQGVTMEFVIIFLIVGLPLGISAFIAGFSARNDERREAEQKMKQAV